MPHIWNRIFIISFCLLLTGLTFLFVPFHSASVSAFSPPVIEVGITLQDSFLQLSFTGNYSLVDQSSGLSLDISPGEYTFLVSGGGIEIRDRIGNNCGFFNSSFYLETLNSSADSVFEIKNARYGKNTEVTEISRDGSSQQLNVVNIIDLEAYLRGVIAKKCLLPGVITGG